LPRHDLRRHAAPRVQGHRRPCGHCGCCHLGRPGCHDCGRWRPARHAEQLRDPVPIDRHRQRAAAVRIRGEADAGIDEGKPEQPLDRIESERTTRQGGSTRYRQIGEATTERQGGPPRDESRHRTTGRLAAQAHVRGTRCIAIVGIGIGIGQRP